MMYFFGPMSEQGAKVFIILAAACIVFAFFAGILAWALNLTSRYKGRPSYDRPDPGGWACIGAAVPIVAVIFVGAYQALTS